MGASKVSEMLGGEASRSVPETCDRRSEAAFVDCFAKFNHPSRVFEDLRPGVGKPESPSGTFDQTHSEPIFQFGDSPAYSRSRHFENAGRPREAARLDNVREHDKGI